MRAPACPKCGAKAIGGAKRGKDGTVALWIYRDVNRHQWSIVSNNPNNK